MLIDEILPEYDEREYHEIEISGERKGVYKALRSLDFSDSPIIRSLFLLRGIRAASIEDLLKVGFVIIHEQPDKELVLGLVGKFWTFTGKIERVDASQYFQFSTRGYAKVAWNFAIDESGQGVVRLSTETRVKCTDGHSRRRFTLYWFLVGHFSRLIRKEILRCVKKSVELT
jgi:hypothetical protein